jgi:hypothetical protein
MASGAGVTRQIMATYKGKGSTENTVTVSSSSWDPTTSNNSSRIAFRLL